MFLFKFEIKIPDNFTYCKHPQLASINPKESQRVKSEDFFMHSKTLSIMFLSSITSECDASKWVAMPLPLFYVSQVGRPL